MDRPQGERIATLEAQHEELYTDVNELKAHITEIKNSLSDINQSLSSIAGARRTLLAMLSAAATAGSFLMWLIDHYLLSRH